ncbi:MAG: integrase arm-type DNA-binding domain-containing protein, partial [Burkholderiaceae bacterium]|nr:integrase arm-type DNA-binding domain-containing protein [Burkholderiaceae bacterium]
MATNKLKPAFCNHAKPGTHFDGGGLYLLVEKSGKKYWRMQCRVNGKRKLLGFGSYPEVTLANAREERRKAQELIKKGIDPIEHTRQQKVAQEAAERLQAKEEGNTFELIAKRLHASKEGKVTDEARDKMLRQLEIHVFPLVGHKRLAEIEGKELLELFRSIADKENHGRKMSYMAKRLCQWSAEVFDFANVEDNNFTLNPCRLIVNHLPSHDTQHAMRIKFQEIGKFIAALDHYPSYEITKAAIWL